MKTSVDRRSFLRIAGSSLGIGALYRVAPLYCAGDTMSQLGRANGERVTPFSFIQISDSHVGFHGPPDPLGTKAFERAVETINALPHQPDLILFTGDLIDDSEYSDTNKKHLKLFREISRGLKVQNIKYVPGEHDAGLDGGELFREAFGETHYSFDHRGVHFIALDNVSRGRPEVGPDQIAWLKKDLARFPKTAPIVVFTHRPLFDLKPHWEWFTVDGDTVMNALEPYQNVTVLYGHIHTEHVREIGNVKHYGARSLIFAFPDAKAEGDKKPRPFDKAQPFKNLGIREVGVTGASMPLTIHDTELTMREFSGTNGIQQILKEPKI
ncbi:MAG: metallophosphoesterase family protein [Bryobacteraceae bacterium]